MGWLIFWGIIVLAIVGLTMQSNAQGKAWRAYQDSLTALKASPSDPNLKQAALQLGRQYANLVRKKKGRSTFDELALMNDINAACASAQHIPPANVSLTAESVEGRLRRLQELRDKELISELEYSDKRKALIDKL